MRVGPPTSRRPTQWDTIEEPVVPPSEKYTFCGDEDWKKFYWKTIGKRCQLVNVFTSIEKYQSFVSVHVDDFKMGGKRQNVGPLWDHCGTFSEKNIDLEDSTLLLTQNLGCIQTKAEVGHHAVQAKADPFRIPTTTEVTDEKQEQNTNSSQSIAACGYDMEGHADTLVERCCDFAGKSVSAAKSAEAPCIKDIPSSPDDFHRTGELAPTLCSDRADVLVPDQNWKI